MQEKRALKKSKQKCNTDNTINISIVDGLFGAHVLFSRQKITIKKN